MTRALLVALMAVLVGTACQADALVVVEVEEDGSGLVSVEVVLDAEATEALADLGADGSLPLSDLAQSGWTVGPPDGSVGGETRITAEKAFGTAGQLSDVMNDLTGTDGVIRNFELTRVQAFGRVDYAIDGVIDPTGGFTAFGDDELTTALGRTLGELAQAPPYEASPEDVTIELQIQLPGEFLEAGSTGSVTENATGPRGLWTTPLSVTRPITISLASSRRSIAAQVFRGVAVVAAVLAALVLFAQLLRVFSARRREAQQERARADRRRAAAANAAQRAEPTPPAGQPVGDAAPNPDEPGAEAVPPPFYKVVALDGPGVLYREGDDIKRLLVPFVRQNGGSVPDTEISDKARQLSLGRMTPADFWRAVGATGDPEELDNAYLAGHQLTPGVVRYLRGLRDGGVRVACITNDAVGWATKLRASHSLDGLIDPWVVSGSVGVRKPDRPLFEVLRRVTGEPPASILVVDDDLDNLDAARELGFGTRWFAPLGERSEARGHEIIRGFEGVNAVDTTEVVLEERPTEE